ncbi:KpsF/GutQ family sugar-phosphate isomerase [Stappia taiwanensis]|uniref:KpsF/GutQ family sugar-phosphate isomerase n=1 Tax=Stappia taiwanensis TaxID=992267 RepID=A0A838XRH4_9HYPH|nr:KpsF/GutQ family sugar-phosphate isomerase [Stappia taiwanensis]MBA4612357.1 KpsF/GutQ family sugar-phosphate isomerase [Stappia taiwanensis]GGF04764.1 KpsF/GutQ family protein [Stappia taiwanensis]
MTATAKIDRPEAQDDARPLASALRTIRTEIDGLEALHEALGNGLGTPFATAVRTIAGAKGRVIVTGVGKSGHVGAKIAATLASTGTPASFVHATEAAHGDLGMITDADVVLALSWSGETQELASIIGYTRRFSVPLVAITSRADSALGSAADILLQLPKVEEACPHGLAPTSSTILQMATGDALAIALLEGRGFTAQDFRVYHPGGRLGASLQHARDIMHGQDALPLTTPETSMGEAIVLITQKGFGVLGVVDADGRLIGIITDGDLRRHLSPDFLDKTVGDVMTRSPKSVAPNMLLASTMEFLNSQSITSVFVVEDGMPVGILHLHDLLRHGVA